MADEKTYSFPESIYRLLMVLKQRGSERVAWAILSLYFDGTEPKSLTEDEWRVFNGIRGRVDAARNNSKRRTGSTTGDTTETGTEDTTETPTGSTTGDVTETETGDTTGAETGDVTESTTTPPTDRDRDRDRDKDKVKRGGARFRAPSAEEVRDYAVEKGLAIDCERFCDFYASKGWRVGNAPMKDWRASARNWARRDDPNTKGGARDADFADLACEF